jgi:hypothetical protein
LRLRRDLCRGLPFSEGEKQKYESERKHQNYTKKYQNGEESCIFGFFNVMMMIDDGDDN